LLKNEQLKDMVKDKYHDLVRQALEKENWEITHDPYKIKLGKRRGYIDLGAEKMVIAAEKKGEKIAVEIKTFSDPSDLHAFENALGQFLIYWRALQIKEPDRILYLGVPLSFYTRFFDDAFFIDIAKVFNVKMIVYDEQKVKIEQWIK
jgi:hypothetical protein